jgi:hypothetical protein
MYSLSESLKQCIELYDSDFIDGVTVIWRAQASLPIERCFTHATHRVVMSRCPLDKQILAQWLIPLNESTNIVSI